MVTDVRVTGWLQTFGLSMLTKTKERQKTVRRKNQGNRSDAGWEGWNDMGLEGRSYGKWEAIDGNQRID